MRFRWAVISLLVLMALCIAPSQSQQINFAFTCEGKNSTMTSYSYMKEPGMEDSGYTRGFKTGSFNYLEKGQIKVAENITYIYGNGTVNSSTSVTHKLDLSFNGTRGISEFYGKAFFRNNRAVSAWKKIRYEDLSKYENVPLIYSKSGYSIATLGKARTAKNFSVEASVEMWTLSKEETYDFEYNANVIDGVIETKDAAGWSNRTGSRRIDFEHDTLMSGEELNVSNVLSDSAPFPVGAGDRDWLSCCIGGTVPPYYPPVDNNDDWPNIGTYMTLSPAKKLPNVNRIQNCTVGPLGEIRCSYPKYENFSCNDTNCTGFECIYQFESTTTPMVRGYPEFANITAIYAIQSYLTNMTKNVTNMTKNVTNVRYNITVENVGEYKLTNVTLTGTLPSKMNYSGSSYIDGSEPREWGRKDLRTENDTRQSVTLLIGDLDTSSAKVVFLNAVHEGPEKDLNYYRGNEVYVIGDLPDGRQVNNTAKPASPPMTQETKPSSDYSWEDKGKPA